MNIRESIEVFHLSFAFALCQKIDPKLFCLKGGCNLRFFFNSIRYSEDIDFDVHTVSPQTLENNVTKLLKDSFFHKRLNLLDLEIMDLTVSKQTDTTQRWKLKLKKNNETLPIPTKIEFSRREGVFSQNLIEHVSPTLIQDYQLQPVFLNHYKAQAAIEQKINALIHRSQTQARDAIDLKLLLDQSKQMHGPQISPATKQKALENLENLTYNEFKSQVWPFLLSEYQSFYNDRVQWENIQNQVFTFLESL